MTNTLSWKHISKIRSETHGKKVTIEIFLVLESLDKKSDEIEGEILKEFRESFLMIPWGYEIAKLRVVDT